MILLTITHIARHGNNLTIEIHPFLFHTKAKVHTDRLTCLRFKTLLLSEHHLICDRVDQAHPYSSPHRLLTLVDNRRSDHSLIAPSQEPRHVWSNHNLLPSHSSSSYLPIVHILGVGKASESPLCKRFRQSECNIHIALSIRHKIRHEESRLLEIASYGNPIKVLLCHRKFPLKSILFSRYLLSPFFRHSNSIHQHWHALHSSNRL